VTIGDLLAALRRYRLLAVGLFTLIVAIGIGSIVVGANRYESDAVVTVTPKADTVGFEAQQTVQFLIPPIIARIGSAPFEENVRARLLPKYAKAPIEIKAVNDPGTSVLHVSARSSSPRAAENAAQVAVARILQEPQSDRITMGMVSPATAATSVKAARAPRILGGTFLLGLIVAVLAAAILHKLRPILPRGERFRERYGHEVIGEVPRGRENEQGTVAEMFNGGDSTDLVEAFRSLEARVAIRVAARGPKDLNASIAVTSWGDNDGKSTVASSLAWALATRGRRVTLVDCDMRRPRAHELLSVAIEPGVADIGEGRQVLSICHETVIRTLDVIPAGRPERHPAEVLHEVLPRFLSALQNRTVIVDTPPMFTAESTAIIGEADYVLLVADYRTRTPDEMEEAISELELAGTPILGVVLNRVTERDTPGRESEAYQSEEPPKPKSAPPKPKAVPRAAKPPAGPEPAPAPKARATKRTAKPREPRS
jgi:Mrp family chromosome partitioning ATPase/capsular polysaccharide biosynthesis protein